MVKVNQIQSGAEETTMTRKNYSVKVGALFELLCDPLQEGRVHGVRLVAAHLQQFYAIPYLSFDHR